MRLTAFQRAFIAIQLERQLTSLNGLGFLKKVVKEVKRATKKVGEALKSVESSIRNEVSRFGSRVSDEFKRGLVKVFGVETGEVSAAELAQLVRYVSTYAGAMTGIVVIGHSAERRMIPGETLTVSDGQIGVLGVYDDLTFIAPIGGVSLGSFDASADVLKELSENMDSVPMASIYTMELPTRFQSPGVRAAFIAKLEELMLGSLAEFYSADEIDLLVAAIADDVFGNGVKQSSELPDDLIDQVATQTQPKADGGAFIPIIGIGTLLTMLG